MSDNNMDFLAIFGGEGSLDLGGGETDFDSLFAQQDQPQQKSETSATETSQSAVVEEPPVSNSAPEAPSEPGQTMQPKTQDSIDATLDVADNTDTSMEKTEEEQAARPEHTGAKPAQPKKSIRSSGEKAPVSTPESDKKSEENPFEVAIKQLETKVAAELAGPLTAKPPVFNFGGVTEDVTDPKMTFEQLRRKRMTFRNWVRHVS